MDKIHKILSVSTIAVVALTLFIISQILYSDKINFTKTVVSTPPVPSAGRLLPVSYGKEEAEDASKKFIEIAGSYVSGDYRNIEAVKSLVSQEYFNKLLNWKRLQKENPPPRHTINATVEKIRTVSIADNRANILADIKRQKIIGYLAPGADTMVWYKEDGTIGEPTKEEINQKIEIILIKEKRFWKINQAEGLP